VVEVENIWLWCAKHGKIEKVTGSRDDKERVRFSWKVAAGDKAFFKSNLDRFVVIAFVIVRNAVLWTS
jgi:hypothetical protein